ncbi:DHHC palmitoyltransferase [Aureococcus anophagefferens]|nr:DHHC palmitoyltransferase [Aureococcus anophagefferens]
MSMRFKPPKKGVGAGDEGCVPQHCGSPTAGGATPRRDADGDDKLKGEGGGVPNWKLWKGKNVFALGGRAMLGADARIFAITNCFVVATALVFFGDLCPRMRGSERERHVYVGAALYACTLGAMWLAALSDPGVIPRSGYARQDYGDDGARLRSRREACEPCDGDEAEGEERETLIARQILDGWQAVVHDASGDVYFWNKRTNESTWDRPVAGGHALAAFVTNAGFAVIFSNYKRKGGADTSKLSARALFVLAIRHRADVLLFAFVSAAILFLLLWLFTYHVFLILSAMTTNEHLKGTYSNKPNPHNRGICSNLWTFLSQACPPSNLVDLSATASTTVVAGARAVAGNAPTAADVAECGDAGAPPS